MLRKIIGYALMVIGICMMLYFGMALEYALTVLTVVCFVTGNLIGTFASLLAFIAVIVFAVLIFWQIATQIIRKIFY